MAGHGPRPRAGGPERARTYLDSLRHVHARAKIALIGAGAGAFLLVLTWFVAFHTGVGARVDRAVLDGFVGLQRPRVNTVASRITQLCDPQPFVVFGAVIVLVALLRRRPRLALAVVAILLCANLTTELLKPLLSARFLPGLPHGARSWPSGHATAAMSLALCAGLVAPRRLRPIVAVAGAGFAVAVGYSILTLEWHWPSDVLAGFLVAGTWTLGVVALLFRFEARLGAGLGRENDSRLSLRQALAPPAVACGAAAVGAGLVVLIHPQGALDYATAHETFIIGAATIGLLGLLVATALMLVRR